MRYASIILWIYNNLDQNFKKCSTRKPIALYILKSNFPLIWSLEMNSSCFPANFLKLKFLVSHTFFAIIKIKTFGLMNFLNTATLIFIYQMLVAK